MQLVNPLFKKPFFLFYYDLNCFKIKVAGRIHSFLQGDYFEEKKYKFLKFTTN